MRGIRLMKESLLYMRSDAPKSAQNSISVEEVNHQLGLISLNKYRICFVYLNQAK